MKKSFTFIFTIIALSLATWFFFYIKTPAAPLSEAETLLVAAGWAAFVYLAKWRIGKIRKKGERNGDKA